MTAPALILELKVIGAFLAVMFVGMTYVVAEFLWKSRRRR